MKTLLVASACIEFAAGAVLLAVPVTFLALLLGPDLNLAAAVPVARLAGAALLALGLACWTARSDVRAGVGVVAAMLLYNSAASALLASLRYEGMAGIGLLPGSVLHAGLALWCIACLRRR